MTPVSSLQQQQQLMLHQAQLRQTLQQQQLQASEKSKPNRRDGSPKAPPPGLPKAKALYDLPKGSSDTSVLQAGMAGLPASCSSAAVSEQQRRGGAQASSTHTSLAVKQGTVGTPGDRKEGGESKVGLSVTASPFIPGTKTEQPAPTTNHQLKKTSPPSSEGAALLSNPRHPPGFEHPSPPPPPLQVAGPVLMQQAGLASGHPLTAVRPLPAGPLPRHPSLPLSLPPQPLAVATFPMQQQPQTLAKTTPLPLHLTAHASRQNSGQPRSVPFFSYHQPPSRGEHLHRHNHSHHSKPSAGPAEQHRTPGHLLLDQSKVIPLPPALQRGTTGLMPTPYPAFIPRLPAAAPSLPLTTTPPVPSPQAMALAKGSALHQQQKQPLLPTPTSVIPSPPVMSSPAASVIAIPPSAQMAVRVPFPLSQEQQQQPLHT